MVKVADETMLMAHLMRRAGFGATKTRLEELAQDGYGRTVDSMIHPDTDSEINDAMVRRYFPDQSALHDSSGAGAYWLYRLVSTKDPLREKMAFFWHNIFATGYAKVTNGRPLSDQLKMFRAHGMGTLDNLLLQLSRDPAMIIWLDNIDNHSGAINENYGRELLELFSMGVGNYTEDDIKECSRAFTGWTIANRDYIKQLAVRNSIWPYGKLAWRYEYDPDDHDAGEKTFLGEKGNFNGEDIIKIICNQPATARFIARHMYHFFVADEPPVPAWPYKDPQDMEAMDILEKAYFDSGHSISFMLETLFKSDFFRSEDCHYKKIKSPAELVTGVMRLTESVDAPQYETKSRQLRMQYMGQTLSNPPSVEGWDGGTAWIDTGALVERMNFASEELGNVSSLGSQGLFKRVVSDGEGELSPQRIVDICLDHVGSISVQDDTRERLVDYASRNGVVTVNDGSIDEIGKEKVAGVLKLIGATPEFQRA